MTTDLNLYVVTWNVAENNPPKDLETLLSLKNEQPADVYVIGLQELKSSTSSILSDSIFDDPWTCAITSVLSARNFVRIKSLRLMGIHISAYIKREYLHNVSSIESEYTRTGFGGYWGNKGGVSIRFELNKVNFCFVNSHLSAHMENFNQRIQDYNQILAGQRFRDTKTRGILEHDYIFWMGDLNFRLDNISQEDTKRKIKENDLPYLLQRDQLNQARLKDMIMIDFEEGNLTFPPTYKFDPGTDHYDTSDKGRIPAWCDRILWRLHEDSFVSASLSVQQLKYNHIPFYNQSDHKPVFSSFKVKVFDSPAEVPVMFEPLSAWSKNKDQNVSFTIPRDYPTSTRDWVGLYPSDFKHFEDYSAYSYLGSRLSDAHDDSYFLFSVSFDERFLDKLPVGSYLMAYFSSIKNCVVGYSNVFKLQDTQVDTSSSDEETKEQQRQKLKRMSAGRLANSSKRFEEKRSGREEVDSGMRKRYGDSVDKQEEIMAKQAVSVANTARVGEKEKTQSGTSSAFENAYMKLREEGQKEKEKERKEGKKEGVNLKVTEELTEEEKNLRMQALDQLISNTHLHNITSDLDNLIGDLDDGKKKNDDGIIKPKKEFKLLGDEEKVPKVESKVTSGAAPSTHQKIDEKSTGDLSGVRKETEKICSTGVEEIFAYETIPKVDAKITSCGIDLKTGQAFVRDERLDEEARKVFDELEKQEKNSQNNNHKPHTLAGSAFEDAYMRAKNSDVSEDTGVEAAPKKINVEDSIDRMINNLNLDDFSQNLGLDSSGKKSKKELDEDRWKDGSGDVKLKKEIDLLIKDGVEKSGKNETISSKSQIHTEDHKK